MSESETTSVSNRKVISALRKEPFTLDCRGLKDVGYLEKLFFDGVTNQVERAYDIEIGAILLWQSKCSDKVSSSAVNRARRYFIKKTKPHEGRSISIFTLMFFIRV